MNELQKELNHIADVVVSSCLTTMSLQGEELVTKEDILNSKNKKQNIVKARHILAFVLYRWGFYLFHDRRVSSLHQIIHIKNGKRP